MEPITNNLNIFASEENSIHYLVELRFHRFFLNVTFQISAFCPGLGDEPENNPVWVTPYAAAIASPRSLTIKKFLRQLVSDSLDFIDLQIVGENVIVEIDETKIGKSKHHKTHSANVAWVLGGVERTEERRLFLVKVPDRTEGTLWGIICTHVLPGSIIMTDCFRSYHNLNEFYTHLTVNHSNTSKDPDTGAHTNCIEGTWNALKYQIPPRNRTNPLDDDGHVVENVLNDHQGNSSGVENIHLIDGPDSSVPCEKLFILIKSFLFLCFFIN
ncbi:hypothetical protein RF11_02630 [Thelohanellus kitauei]|uniref:ISXO2-like transposase domain-containing protein n=1 Tax=Thelohanellus kitauei TaxID=669202 RepID=A0A0C2JF55_THEKT|nr:hypothetical protein RF11_02630 [Thelohanellus kitauei]